MPSTIFKENLTAFDLSLKTGKEGDGVVLTSQINSSPDNLTPQEFFALETAERFGADAVYFRCFNDGRESVPQIYIYDDTANQLSGREAEVHVKVWSGCIVPMFIIIGKTDVRIFDARESVQVKGNSLHTDAIETIKLSGEVIHRFSSLDFSTGMFWEDKKYEKHFQFATSAYRLLIDGLKKVYNDFQEQSGLSQHVALKLLVQCLLVKYLEERDEESNSGYFAKNYFRNHFKVNTFCEVIANGQLLDLLDKLSNDFNGKIFEWDKDEEKTARNNIKKAKVKKLADYLDGKTHNDQYVLWRLYSFSHLPVELISSVYEELLGKGKKDTVYTPDMIASTLVDECMPLKHPRKDFKLIDVSCGSGIFLVKAYKRIIQWWRYEQWQSKGVADKPDLATMKQLLKTSIHGIDIQEDAVRLSVFSLALALLDDLDPKTIWTKLRFENLSKENIIAQDFFEFITNNPPTDFDLVIGNPPFNPPNGLSNGGYYKELKKKYDYRSEIDIPDYNLALIFLTEAMKLIKPGALLCLIQPSGPLLYQNDTAFKQAVFSKHNLLQVIDFTRLGDVLWGKANVATAAVFLQNSTPDEKQVAHITVQRTPANLKKLFLELDHYDFHLMSKEVALSNPFIWKANLLGGARIVGLLDKLSKLETLGEYLTEKELQDNWSVGEGFIEKGTDPKSAKYITGKQYLPSEAFTEDGIDWSKVHPCKIKLFKRPRKEHIYTPPHLLIKENIGNSRLSVHLSDEHLVFRANVIGIHAPQQHRDQLQLLHEYFVKHNDVLRFFIRATSSQLSISKATVPLKEDFMNLPYPSNKAKLSTSTAEKIVINDVLSYQLNDKTATALNNTSSVSSIKHFSRIFSTALNSVYRTESKQFHLIKILDAGSFFALHFNYSEKNSEPEVKMDVDLEKYISQFIPKASISGRTHIQRILKYYSKDTIILAKPKSLRYWLQSVALRDADETFADYVKAGF